MARPKLKSVQFPVELLTDSAEEMPLPDASIEKYRPYVRRRFAEFPIRSRRSARCDESCARTENIFLLCTDCRPTPVFQRPGTGCIRFCAG